MANFELLKVLSQYVEILKYLSRNFEFWFTDSIFFLFSFFLVGVCNAYTPLQQVALTHLYSDFPTAGKHYGSRRGRRNSKMEDLVSVEKSPVRIGFPGFPFLTVNSVRWAFVNSRVRVCLSACVCRTLFCWSLKQWNANLPIHSQRRCYVIQLAANVSITFVDLKENDLFLSMWGVYKPVLSKCVY